MRRTGSRSRISIYGYTRISISLSRRRRALCNIQWAVRKLCRIPYNCELQQHARSEQSYSRPASMICGRSIGLARRGKIGNFIASYSPCLGMPSVISTVFRRHATQRLAELGTMGVPQSAHSTRCTAGAGTNSIVRSRRASLYHRSWRSQFKQLCFKRGDPKSR